MDMVLYRPHRSQKQGTEQLQKSFTVCDFVHRHFMQPPALDAGRITAGALYDKCLNAEPPLGGWFSIWDTLTRLSLTFYSFYRFLLLRPFSLLYFAYGWNTLWYGRICGLLLTFSLPVLPFFLCGVEVLKRIGEQMPWAEEDWKLKGPGRVFFVRPDTFIASLFWDFQLAMSVFCGSFLQFGTDRDGLMHTWYAAICNKDYWHRLLDQVDARRPMQLASWDGMFAHATGPGPEYGSSDLVSKINDSYLGIGDKMLKRGKVAGGDFDTLADIQAILEADPRYHGKQAILSEVHNRSPLESLLGAIALHARSACGQHLIPSPFFFLVCPFV